MMVMMTRGRREADRHEDERREAAADVLTHGIPPGPKWKHREVSSEMHAK
jgi:hypothetical protein